MHGVAVMDFGPAHLPAAQGFDRDDAAFVAAHGFDVVRVGFNWALLEPKPGAIDGAYLGSIRRTVRQLAAHRVWSVLDLHQDGWGSAVHGNEGAPDWATITDGFPNPPLGFGANYLANPAQNRAWDNFWANAPGPGGIGLQDRYATMLRRLGAAFRTEPYVLGYEILNEPWPGTEYPTCMNPAGCPLFDTQKLEPFYRRVIPAIHAADPARMVFYEPNLLFDFGANTNLGNPAPGDPLTGFTFHDYCLGAGAGSALPVIPGNAAGCAVEEKTVLDYAESYSQKTGAALLNTEWSASSELATVKRMAAELDAARIPWTYWQYCCAADNMTLVADAKKPPRPPNLHPHVLSLIEIPYPRAVAGTPGSWGFNPDTRTFTLDYSTALLSERPGGALLTQIYVPRLQYPTGYAVQVTGAARTSARGAGLLTLCASKGAKKVTVRVAPARGGHTAALPDPAPNPTRCSTPHRHRRHHPAKHRQGEERR